MATHIAAPNFTAVGSKEVGDPVKDGETRIRRMTPTADALVTQPFEGIDVVPDCLDYAARSYGTKNAMGWRDIIDIHEEQKDVKKMVDGKEVTEKKTWKYFELSDYKYLSYTQVREAAHEVAGGLLELGIGEKEIVNLYASTSVNWQLFQHGCSTIGTTIATAYDTLGESGLTHAINEPECVGIFTNADLFPVLMNVIPNTPSLRFVIYDGEVKPKQLESLKAARESITVLTLDELRAKGKGKEIPADRRPSPEDIACIMYTSGTTGAPKGAVITHANLIASVGAVRQLLGHHFQPEDTFLAFLPLAHILEYIVELALFFFGMPIGYGRVKTLTDASVRKCQGDIKAFKPSIMVGVPQIWETIRKGIVGRVNSSGTIKKSVFTGAMAVKKAGVPGLSQLVDNAVLAQVKAQTGGRLRLALSGSAALSKETQEFLSVALVMMLQGYGMTESCGMCAILPPEFFQYGSVGIPVPSVEIKLLDVPEAGYRSTNTPPQGEVLIRGPSVIKGYYKRDDLNNDPSIFTPDGWLRTGDVGQWNKDGTLSLIDRIKNLVKLQGGEYIALERLESVYKSCNLVSNICVFGSADVKQPIAIVIPHESNLRHFLSQQSVDSSRPLPDLCADPKVVNIVLKECNAVGKKNQFKPMETLNAVVLSHDEWTPENGLTTAANKVQRKKVQEKFDKEIKDLYKKQDN